MLSEPVEGGGTNRDHFRQLEKQGRRVDELHPEPPNYLVAHVWEYFAELSQLRGQGMSGPMPLQPQFILGWCQLRDIELMPVEIDMLMKIEMAYLAHWIEVHKNG